MHVESWFLFLLSPCSLFFVTIVCVTYLKKWLNYRNWKNFISNRIEFKFYHPLSVRQDNDGEPSFWSLVLGKLDLTNAKHIYRFEPNPFLPELALHMSHLTRLASYLTSDSYREVYQSYFLDFDDHEVNDLTKKSNKKTKHLPTKSKWPASMRTLQGADTVEAHVGAFLMTFLCFFNRQMYL